VPEKPKNSFTKGSLSAPRQRVLETMQRLNFGTIEGLRIRAGEPVFDPPPRLIRDIKLGGENGPRPELSRPDFALKNQVAELFEHLSHIDDGSVALIEVKHGLPFRLVIEDPSM
jgi:hypothetical protein